MRAALYARFSTDMQRQASIEDQMALCRDLAAKLGATVVAEYSDAGISGFAAANRPGLQELLAAADTHAFDLVIAEALDRLSRSGADSWAVFQDLEARGIRIVTAAESDVGELQVGLKSTMNALFLKDLAAKTRRGLAGVAREGRHAGGRVYGYRRVRGLTDAGEPIRGQLEQDPEEAEVVRRIFREYAAGASPRAIAARLNAQSLPGPRGGAWNASTINGNAARGNGVLHNQLYRGWLVWGRQTWVKDRRTGRRRARTGLPEHQVRTERPELRIVDDDLWDQVRARCAAVARGASGPRAAVRPKHLLSGLVICGCCRGPMTLSGPDSRFLCVARKERGPAVCANGRTAKAADIEARILECIRVGLLHPAVIADAVEEYRREAAQRRVADRQRRTALERELAESTRRAERLVDQVADGHIAGQAVRERLGSLEAERARLETELATIAAAAEGQLATLHPRAAEFYRGKVEALKQALEGPEGLARDEARQAFRQLVRAIVVTPLEKRGEYQLSISGDPELLTFVVTH
jgi:site-specific DNA recombinase